ncbi:hypothetical protein MYIN104542_30050 [Mycobacterium intermedium]
MPWCRRIRLDDLDGFGELIGNPGHQMRVAPDYPSHRGAKPVRIKRTGKGDAHLHRVDLVATLGRDGVKQQPLLQWRQRQNVVDRVEPAQFIDLLLIEPGGRDVRRTQAAPALAYVGTDSRQRLEPQAIQPLDLLRTEYRRRPGPFGLQARPDVGIDGGGVEFHTVRQRHWYGGRGTGDLRRALRA